MLLLFQSTYVISKHLLFLFIKFINLGHVIFLLLLQFMQHRFFVDCAVYYCDRHLKTNKALKIILTIAVLTRKFCIFLEIILYFLKSNVLRHIYIYIYICIYIYIYIYMCVCVCICMYVCMYSIW